MDFSSFPYLFIYFVPFASNGGPALLGTGWLYLRIIQPFPCQGNLDTGMLLRAVLSAELGT